MQPDPLTIIAVIVAVFVIWKLRSVLGQRTGGERPPSNPFVRQAERPHAVPSRDAGAPLDGSPIRSPGAGTTKPDLNRWHPHAAAGTPVAAGLDAVAAQDPAFSVAAFLDGAKIAYETVVTAFAQGDKAALQRLLSREVYQSFLSALSSRAARGETLSTTFVSIDSATLEAAFLEGRIARLDVRFASKQVSATRDKEGQVTDGNADKVVEVEDVWTFARDVTSRDPNWKLVATRSGH